MIGLWFGVLLTAGETAGASLALVEPSFLGVSLDYYYMDTAEAGLLCSMNRLKEWYPF